MLSKEDLNTVVQTIYSQIGGGRFKVMTGAKDFTAHNEQCGGLSFKLPRFSGIKINHVKIVLNGSDLYDITFGRIHGNNFSVISEHKDVYNDDLRPLFESETGLRTSL